MFLANTNTNTTVAVYYATSTWLSFLYLLHEQFNTEYCVQKPQLKMDNPYHAELLFATWPTSVATVQWWDMSYTQRLIDWYVRCTNFVGVKVGCLLCSILFKNNYLTAFRLIVYVLIINGFFTGIKIVLGI